ncbi:unnamed protein product [Owenia fusiformis]|uniref:Uncharacterized protein n=1 Tax=Owenia fusiformis TaxID=6347 RepID=A0A8J1UHK5_OWEFU|nr:unnamed protein product [Owenia fusiformis]
MDDDANKDEEEENSMEKTPKFITFSESFTNEDNYDSYFNTVVSSSITTERDDDMGSKKDENIDNNDVIGNGKHVTFNNGGIDQHSQKCTDPVNKIKIMENVNDSDNDDWMQPSMNTVDQDDLLFQLQEERRDPSETIDNEEIECENETEEENNIESEIDINTNEQENIELNEQNADLDEQDNDSRQYSISNQTDHDSSQQGDDDLNECIDSSSIDSDSNLQNKSPQSDQECYKMPVLEQFVSEPFNSTGDESNPKPIEYCDIVQQKFEMEKDSEFTVNDSKMMSVDKEIVMNDLKIMPNDSEVMINDSKMLTEDVEKMSGASETNEISLHDCDQNNVINEEKDCPGKVTNNLKETNGEINERADTDDHNQNGDLDIKSEMFDRKKSETDDTTDLSEPLPSVVSPQAMTAATLEPMFSESSQSTQHSEIANLIKMSNEIDSDNSPVIQNDLIKSQFSEVNMDNDLMGEKNVEEFPTIEGSQISTLKGVDQLNICDDIDKNIAGNDSIKDGETVSTSRNEESQKMEESIPVNKKWNIIEATIDKVMDNVDHDSPIIASEKSIDNADTLKYSKVNESYVGISRKSPINIPVESKLNNLFKRSSPNSNSPLDDLSKQTEIIHKDVKLKNQDRDTITESIEAVIRASLVDDKTVQEKHPTITSILSTQKREPPLPAHKAPSLRGLLMKGKSSFSLSDIVNHAVTQELGPEDDTSNKRIPEPEPDPPKRKRRRKAKAQKVIQNYSDDDLSDNPYMEDPSRQMDKLLHSYGLETMLSGASEDADTELNQSGFKVEQREDGAYEGEMYGERASVKAEPSSPVGEPPALRIESSYTLLEMDDSAVSDHGDDRPSNAVINPAFPDVPQGVSDHVRNHLRTFLKSQAGRESTETPPSMSATPPRSISSPMRIGGSNTKKVEKKSMMSSPSLVSQLMAAEKKSKQAGMPGFPPGTFGSNPPGSLGPLGLPMPGPMGMGNLPLGVPGLGLPPTNMQNLLMMEYYRIAAAQSQAFSEQSGMLSFMKPPPAHSKTTQQSLPPGAFQFMMTPPAAHQSHKSHPELSEVRNYSMLPKPSMSRQIDATKEASKTTHAPSPISDYLSSTFPNTPSESTSPEWTLESENNFSNRKKRRKRRTSSKSRGSPAKQSNPLCTIDLTSEKPVCNAPLPTTTPEVYPKRQSVVPRSSSEILKALAKGPLSELDKSTLGVNIKNTSGVKPISLPEGLDKSAIKSISLPQGSVTKDTGNKDDSESKIKLATLQDELIRSMLMSSPMCPTVPKETNSRVIDIDKIIRSEMKVYEPETEKKPVPVLSMPSIPTAPSIGAILTAPPILTTPSLIVTESTMSGVSTPVAMVSPNEVLNTVSPTLKPSNSDGGSSKLDIRSFPTINFSKYGQKNSKQLFGCTLCKKLFPRLRIHKHLSLDHGQPRFKCSLCDFSDDLDLEIKQHIIKEHNSRFSIRCSICKGLFPTKKEVRNHIFQEHELQPDGHLYRGVRDDNSSGRLINLHSTFMTVGDPEDGKKLQLNPGRSRSRNAVGTVESPLESINDSANDSERSMDSTSFYTKPTSDIPIKIENDKDLMLMGYGMQIDTNSIDSPNNGENDERDNDLVIKEEISNDEVEMEVKNNAENHSQDEPKVPPLRIKLNPQCITMSPTGTPKSPKSPKKEKHHHHRRKKDRKCKEKRHDLRERDSPRTFDIDDLIIYKDVVLDVPMYACQLCDFMCGNDTSQPEQMSIYQHIREEHNVLHYQCKLCGRQSASDTFIMNHIIVEHNVTEHVDVQIEDLHSRHFDTIFKLSDKGTDFWKEYVFLSKCNLCGFLSSTPVKTSPESEKSIPDNKDMLHFHLQKVHSIPRYTCNICEYSTDSSPQMYLHLRMMKDTHNTSLFKCRHCNLVFDKEDEALDHASTKHQKVRSSKLIRQQSNYMGKYRESHYQWFSHDWTHRVNTFTQKASGSQTPEANHGSHAQDDSTNIPKVSLKASNLMDPNKEQSLKDKYDGEAIQSLPDSPTVYHPEPFKPELILRTENSKQGEDLAYVQSLLSTSAFSSLKPKTPASSPRPVALSPRAAASSPKATASSPKAKSPAADKKLTFCDFGGCEFSTLRKSKVNEHYMLHNYQRIYKCLHCNKSYSGRPKGICQHSRRTHPTEDPETAVLVSKDYGATYVTYNEDDSSTSDEGDPPVNEIKQEVHDVKVEPKEIF